MNLDIILRGLELGSNLGHIISTEEGLVLHNSLLILQKENHFKQVFFWGKIFGAEKDYYIAYGYEIDILTGKIFYYSNNCMDWGRLPKPTKNGIKLSPLCFTSFQGDPALVSDVTIEMDETAIPGDRKSQEIHKLKEEDRLASIVHTIMNEAGVIPRGALFKQPDGVVIENMGFEGLTTLDAREIKSFQHFRIPTRKLNVNLLTRQDYNYAIDFLDPLDTDIPQGCWQIQVTPDEDYVILRSMYWPGLLFFHKLRTHRHGFIYFGYGKKCVDSPFLLSPFFT